MKVGLLMLAVLLALAGCEEMVDEPDEVEAARCDVARDWYIGLPIVRVYETGSREPPVVLNPNTGEYEADWSAMNTIKDTYESLLHNSGELTRDRKVSTRVPFCCA